jgi:hypothetical protein
VAQEKLEMLDLDHSMRTDIECTKSTMMELRDYCIDIGRMFEQLGYDSAGLKRRQAALVAVLDASCASASRMQEALTGMMIWCWPDCAPRRMPPPLQRRGLALRSLPARSCPWRCCSRSGRGRA